MQGQQEYSVSFDGVLGQKPWIRRLGLSFSQTLRVSTQEVLKCFQIDFLLATAIDSYRNFF